MTLLKLFQCFKDGMILQRNKEVYLWGIAVPNREINILFLDKKYQVYSDKSGNWDVWLVKSAAGGPYEMKIVSGNEQITINDILIGDVYHLSGQSNMELPISRTQDRLSKEIAKIDNPYIREFHVPIVYEFNHPNKELSGGEWIRAQGESIMNLSAVGYFFAAKLYERYHIPIGLINTAVGGSPVETRLSLTTLKNIGGYDDIIAQCQDDAFVTETQKTENERMVKWNTKLDESDLGLANVLWNAKDFDDTNWKQCKIPFYFSDTELADLCGSVWFRKEVDVPKNSNLTNLLLKLGTIIDADTVYINGVKIGNTGYMYPPRRYSIPDGILHSGKNLIAVRVIVNRGCGGFVAGKPYCIEGLGSELDLSGNWKYAVGTRMPELPQTTFFQYKPAGLYNGMLAPLHKFTFNGILWYQGESNDSAPERYEKLFEAMVCEWRKDIYEELPFIFVQLPNFDDPTKSIAVNSWAIIREAQRRILTLPKTAMVVSIDVGESNDLHPQDKLSVGRRLALCAQNIVYGEDIEYSGPCCEKAEFTDAGKHNNSSFVILTFSHIGNGLVLQANERSYFEMCGKDGVYYTAHAEIQNNTIILSCPEVNKPTSVRYAWCNNPVHPELYNENGLPASPFVIEI